MIAFPYTDSTLAGKQTSKTIPHTIASKINKVLRNKLIQEVKMSPIRIMTLMKRINKWKSISFSQIGRLNTFSMFLLAKIPYRSSFFIEVEKSMLKLLVSQK